MITADLGTDKYTIHKEAALSIYPIQNEYEKKGYRLVYALDIYLEEQPDAWRYFIDAQTGDIVRKKNLLSHGNEVDVNTPPLADSEVLAKDAAENAAWFRINGTGTVYTMSPNLNTSTSSETLHRLDNLSPRKLRGDNITVDYYNNNDASSSTGVLIMRLLMPILMRSWCTTTVMNLSPG